MLFLIRLVLSLLALACVAATFLPFWDTNNWIVRWAEFPRLQIMAALGLLLILLLALPGRLRLRALVVEGLALAAFAAQCWVLYPYAPLRQPQIVSATCAPESRMAVMAVNVQMTNENAERLLEIIAATDPDLILFQETDEWWDERLKALSDAYPHAVQQVTQNFFGIHLLSRYPLVGAEVRNLTSSRDPSIFTGVELPGGEVVSFYGVHPRPPEIGQSSAERDGQLLAAALAIRGDERPSVLAGDLNATSWSQVVRRTARVGGLLEPRIGRGWKPTFRTGSWVVTWPLDHILPGDAFTVEEFQALRDFGSDHRPIYAELCLDPDAAELQEAPPARPEDLEAAKAAIAAGQNRAVPSPEPQPQNQVPGTGSG